VNGLEVAFRAPARALLKRAFLPPDEIGISRQVHNDVLLLAADDFVVFATTRASHDDAHRQERDLWKIFRASKPAGRDRVGKR
jgi:hypothetical protein